MTDRVLVVPGAAVADLRTGPGWTRHEPSRLLVRVDCDPLRVRRQTTCGVLITWDGTITDTSAGPRLDGRHGAGDGGPGHVRVGVLAAAAG